VLPVFVGRATRGVEFFEHAEKTYETLLRLGVTTDTEDITGTVLTERDVFVTGTMVEEVLTKFRGEIMQVPPMYSALKVNGQKLYDLARKGKEVERQPRPITIHELTLLGMEADGIRLRVRCSKGTYIRTLCKDIGETLGCGGCMAQLRRVTAGEYTIAQAVPLKTLIESENPEQYLLAVDSMFKTYPEVILTAKQEKCCRNGVAFTVDLPEGKYRVYAQNGEFLALSHMVEGKLTTIKSFWNV
jgi:tRNA pseudouridine55 synthase